MAAAVPRTRLGVLGWPVAHSRSPRIQNAALRAVGLSSWRYQLLPVASAAFADTVRGLPQSGFRGANVTIPHKEAALALADEPTEKARTIGAANTLLFESDGQLKADNTDAPGLLGALPIDPKGRSALVLGAGGSARAAVWALLDAGAGEVRVWNRTPERATRLSEELGAIAVTAAAPADLLINCTSSGLDARESTFKQLPVSADDLRRYECVVDFVYSDVDTALVRAARERSLPAVDGLELLVRQAALSFELFTGQPAPVDVMRDALTAR
ncbi:MAG: shikimate dehydrogenase [Solirubrobacterales bacterium]|nr:shikimate dehydrogenase [Solirubrobacterales bacterium]